MKLRASLVAIAALASMAHAGGITLYEDIKTKQIFTEPGENRQKLGEFVQENNVAELMSKEVKGVSVSSGAAKIEIHGTHYLGFTSSNYGAVNGASAGAGSSSSGFEMRRNYLDFKAHFADSKDYVRLTLDATKEAESTSGAAQPKIKYAYLYLDNILPYTGVEMGSVHRPWIDYEEGNSWYFRSINKVILEDKFASVATSGAATLYDAPGLLSSADVGVDFKVKTPYISSEFGAFNGASYDHGNTQKSSTKLSYEGRLTAHVLGTGTAHINKWKDQYLNISVSGIQNNNLDNATDGTTNPTATTKFKREGYWLHAVYNHPMFLIAAQYNQLEDKYYNATGTTQQTTAATSDKKYKMYSVNGEFRPFSKWTILGRYDNLKYEQSNLTGANDAAVNGKDAGDADQYIYGVAYDYSKNVTFIANGKTVKNKNSNIAYGTTQVGDEANKQSYMLTAEVKW